MDPIFNRFEPTMLDVDNCGKWVSKRNLKVENFLRKHLRNSDWGFTRYYETCVAERKGALLLWNVILTGQFLLFTENPPKKFTVSIPLSDIQNISLVADRKTLIKGGNNNSYICQHVRLLYKKTSDEENKKGSDTKIAAKIKISIVQSETDLESTQSSSSVDSAFSPNERSSSSNFSNSRNDFISDGTSTSLSMSTHRPKSTTDTDFTYSDVSRQSSSMDNSYIPMSIYNAYEPTVIPASPRILNSPSETGSFLDTSYVHSTSDESDRTISSSSGSLKLNSGHQRYKHNRNRKFSSRMDDLTIRDRGSPTSDGTRSPYSDLENGREIPYGVLKKGIDMKRVESKRSRGLSPRRVVDSRTNFVIEQRPSWTKEEDESELESVQQQKRKNGQERKKKTRPRSVDVSQLSNLRKKIFGKVFGSRDRNDSSLSRTIKGSTPQLVTENDLNDGNSDDFIKGEDEVVDESNLEVLDFYLYQPNSALLNELFLFWNRNILKSTLQMDSDHVLLRDSGGDKHQYNRSSRAAEKAFIKLSRLWSPVDNALWTNSGDSWSFTALLPKLGSLHKALMRYDQLSRLCWKNWDMLANLLGILRICTKKMGEDDVEDEDYFLDKVSAFTVIMDIFRLLYEACGTCWFLEDSKAIFFTNNNNDSSGGNEYESRILELSSEEIPMNLHEVTNLLIKTVFQCTMIPHEGIAGRKGIIAIVCNPHKFSNGRWIYYPDSKAIKVVTMAHNASVALLHEILSIVHFSSKDKERAKFMSYLQNSSMETYVKLSVTQVVNLLWSNRRPIGSFQAVLLFRHVSTLKTLLEIVPNLKSFVRDTFCEEFQYFVHGRSAAKKISDRYPLKLKLLASCDQLRQDIISK